MSMAVQTTSDVRETGRVVASVLLASGTPPPEALARANAALGRLRRPALAPRDLVVSTPEELAERIPAELREPLADVLLELSADEPIRRRVALGYLGLWGIPAPAPPPAPERPGEARPLPRRPVAAAPPHVRSRGETDVPRRLPNDGP